MKAPEPPKQVVTHKAEVTRHYDADLSVHGLHNREDRDIITLGRTEQVFTAEEETVPLGYFAEVERVIAVEETEGDGWTRSPKPKKDEEPEELNVEKKKVNKLPKDDEQRESVKLKAFKKSEKQDEEPQKVRLKKILPKAKEPEKEVITHRVEVTRHYDSEVTVQNLHLRDDLEVKTVVRTEQVFTATQEPSDLGHTEELQKLEAEDKKNAWIRTPKGPKDEESEKDLTKKKIKLLQKKEGELEVVKLKPFEKPQKTEAEEPAKTQKKSETETECSSFKRSEALQRDQPTATIKHREDSQVNKDQQEVHLRTEDGPKDEEPAATHKPEGKAGLVSTSHVTLNLPATARKHEDKADRTSDDKTSRPKEKTQKDLEEPQLSKDDVPKPPEKKKPSPSEKKVAEEKIPQKQTDAFTKGFETKWTLSPRVAEDKAEDKQSITPVDTSPKDLKSKPKDLETEKKLRTVTLKRTPQKPSPEEAPGPEEPTEKQVHLVKQVSPGAVQLKKVPTQPEEEVFEEETEEKEGGEEEEAWGWELVPPEDRGGEGVDGAVETPGPPSSKRGEVTAAQLLELLHPSPLF